MEFEPLYFRDRVQVLNPHGTIGVVTLWSKVDYVVARFREAGVDLDPATSPIAVFGNLYGNGLREMLRNLLYNPQIRALVICGNDRSGSLEELSNFFGFDLEPVESSLVSYISPRGGNRVSPCRIAYTNRIIDDLVQRQDFTRDGRIWGPELNQILGDLREAETLKEIKEKIDSLETSLDLNPRTLLHRKEIPLPELEVQYFPSNPRGHVVIQDTILDAWKEVLYRLTRFGHRVTLPKGDRLELQHVKVVVEQPGFEEIEPLKSVNLDPDRLRSYQQDLLRGELRPDETYNYGHRLRAYFGLDALAACATRLQQDPEDRKSYVSLWDTARDLTAAEGRPCLVSLFFRKFEGKLTLSAAFRTHNAMDAYPMNLYGLTAIRDWVAARAGLTPGALTVISHSLGLDPRELDRAMLIIGQRPFKVRLDPMGYFRITLDNGEILVEHRCEDVTLKEYRGKKAARLQHELARDLALSDVNHAIYLGRQLARAETALKEGREFVQE
jgi:thymidylate synthase